VKTLVLETETYRGVEVPTRKVRLHDSGALSVVEFTNGETMIRIQIEPEGVKNLALWLNEHLPKPSPPQDSYRGEERSDDLDEATDGLAQVAD